MCFTFEVALELHSISAIPPRLHDLFPAARVSKPFSGYLYKPDKKRPSVIEPCVPQI